MAHPEEQDTNTAILGLSKLLPPIHSKFRIRSQLEENGRSNGTGAFEDLRQRLMSAPVLSFPDFFTLDTDSSDTGIGAVLSQTQDESSVSLSNVIASHEKSYWQSLHSSSIFAHIYLVEHLCFVRTTDRYRGCPTFVIPKVSSSAG